MKFKKLGSCKKGGPHCGRKGLPAAWIDQMYADYLRLNSLSEVGKLHGRTRQAMWDIFSRRKLPMRSRNLKDQWVYGGRKYTPGKDEYLRDTIFRNRGDGVEPHLHRRIWADHFGPIPPGYNVHFKDGNIRNFAVSNLVCAPIAEISALTATGANQFTNSANERLTLLIGGDVASATLKARAA